MPHRIMQAVWHAQQALQLITQIAEELQQEKDVRNFGYTNTMNQMIPSNSYGMQYPVGYQPVQPVYDQQPIQTGITYGMMYGTHYESPGQWNQSFQAPLPQSQYQPISAGTNVPVVWEEVPKGQNNARMSETSVQNSLMGKEPQLEAKGNTGKKTVGAKAKTVRKSVAEDNHQAPS